MSAPLHVPASDTRRPVVQPETNADAPRGFVQLPRAILFDTNLKLAARALYAALLSYSWGKGFCYPSQERLARDIGLSVPTVRKHLAELEKAGLVRCETRGRRETTVYHLSVEAGAEPAEGPKTLVPKNLCPKKEVDLKAEVDVPKALPQHKDNIETLPPPPLGERKAAGGRVSRTAPPEEDDLTDHGEHGIDANRPALAKELRGFGVPPRHAAAFAATDYPEEVARSICQQARRDGVNGGIMAWRLKYHAPAVEQELAERRYTEAGDPSEVVRAKAIRQGFKEVTGLSWPGGQPPGYWKLMAELRARGTGELLAWTELMASIPVGVVPDDAVPVEWYLQAATDTLRRPWSL